MKHKSTWIAWGAYSLSATAHGAFLLAPPTFEVSQPTKPTPSLVQFTVPESPPQPAEPVEPEPEVQPEPEPPPVVPKPQPVPTPEVIAPQNDVQPEPAPAEAPAEAPPELTGTTLLSEGEGSFSAEAGSGRSRQGAIRAGISKASTSPTTNHTLTTSQPKTSKAAEPVVEALKNLLKKPKPPELGNALKRNYPSQARAQGKSGDAKVRARVDADGQIRVVRVMAESESGFGQACALTLKQSRWTAPVAQSGQPVATWISYRCSFVVDN